MSWGMLENHHCKQVTASLTFFIFMKSKHFWRPHIFQQQHSYTLVGLPDIFFRRQIFFLQTLSEILSEDKTQDTPLVSFIQLHIKDITRSLLLYISSFDRRDNEMFSPLCAYATGSTLFKKVQKMQLPCAIKVGYPQRLRKIKCRDRQGLTNFSFLIS